ncbi:hypothetical protein BDR26DRAFT_183716 [Obelidium mucronatum]|nr:hypothetical protein BDR26DRAFT_183716 [Obelidium mucronatum]
MFGGFGSSGFGQAANTNTQPQSVFGSRGFANANGSVFGANAGSANSGLGTGGFSFTGNSCAGPAERVWTAAEPESESEPECVWPKSKWSERVWTEPERLWSEQPAKHHLDLDHTGERVWRCKATWECVWHAEWGLWHSPAATAATTTTVTTTAAARECLWLERLWTIGFWQWQQQPAHRFRVWESVWINRVSLWRKFQAAGDGSLWNQFGFCVWERCCGSKYSCHDNSKYCAKRCIWGHYYIGTAQ